MRYLSLIPLTLLSLTSCGFSKLPAPTFWELESQPTYQEAEGIEDTPLIPEAIYEGERSPWWLSFGEEELNRFIDQGLCNNFEVKAAVERLQQAFAAEAIANAPLFPTVNLAASAEYRRTHDHVLHNTDSTTILHLLPELQYELDLRGKLSANSAARRQDTIAACCDVLTARLNLSSAITNVWLTFIEQAMLEKLLHKQLNINRTLLELLELRFQAGFEGTNALDIFQQRQSIAAIESQLPNILSLKTTSRYVLATLLGQVPDREFTPITEDFPNLPPLPQLGAPCDLLFQRSDLCSARASLQAADFDLAVAFADLFPRLNLIISYDWTTLEPSKFFQREVARIFSDIFQPIFDGGRRRGEYYRRYAIAKESAYTFSQSYLNALEEVENALQEERYQKELLIKLDEQRKDADDTLNEAIFRYAHGLNDYLPVIEALQDLQGLEQTLIDEKKALLTIRVRLYTSLGGFVSSWKRCDLPSP